MAETLLVASPGGHLDELMILVDELGVNAEDAVWVTGRTPQTESLLRDRDVVWVPRVGSGEMAKAALGLPSAIRLHRRVRPRLLVSTGALFSTPHLMAASLFGCETWFIDSATRVQAPSRTGVFARRLTRAKLFVQGTGWGDPAWTPVPSVFDAFEAVPRVTSAEADPRTAVVSLGTELWPFTRAVERVLELLPDSAITWQTGATEYSLEGRPLQQWMPALDLYAAFADADVVVTHAGVGSVLSVLNQGKVPVILPRLAAHREMIDDHQVEFAEMIAERGLAVIADPSELRLEHLRRAASLSARRLHHRAG